MPIEPTAFGVILTVRLTPRGGRDQIDGVERDGDGRPCLKVRVSAAPVDGQANIALVKLLSKTLMLPKSAIRFHAGETARIKRLAITAEASEIKEKLGL